MIFLYLLLDLIAVILLGYGGLNLAKYLKHKGLIGKKSDGKNDEALIKIIIGWVWGIFSILSIIITFASNCK